MFPKKKPKTETKTENDEIDHIILTLKIKYDQQDQNILKTLGTLLDEYDKRLSVIYYNINLARR